MKECMVTTIDNPWNPFTRFREWYTFDMSHGYRTCELLAYFAKTSTELDEEFYHEEVERAISELLAFNPFGMHIKVYEDEAESLIRIVNKAYEDYLKAS